MGAAIHDNHAPMSEPAPTALTALMPGSPGRWPYAGHVRGQWRRNDGTLALAWAGRIAASCGPEEAWQAAEALRASLAAGIASIGAAANAATALDLMWLPLATLPPPLVAREDLTLLIAPDGADGVRLIGCGLASVSVEGAGGFVGAVLVGSPLLGEPGLPAVAPTPEAPQRAGRRFIALPPGLTLPDRARLDSACGVHA